MKIAVCMKQVPSIAGPLQIDAASHWIREADSAFETSSADINALEEALRIKDKTGAEVVAVALGAERVSVTLREALAKGADRAIHVVLPDAHGLDPRALALMLAEVLREENCDLILAGSQSDDHGHAQTGVALAECMGWPHVSMVAELVLGEGGRARARRELESGWYQWMEFALPGVLTIQSGINKPRYAGMKGMLAAKKKTIVCVNAAIPDLNSRQETEQLYLPYKTKDIRMLEGSPADQATALVDALNLRACLA